MNNLMVNALNAQAVDPLASCCAFIDALPVGIVGEIHLAGYNDQSDFGLVIDDHGSRVREAVWAAYAHALRRFGAAANARRVGHRPAPARRAARRGRRPPRGCRPAS